MDYFDIFGENTTKLSTYEETYEPNLKLSTMLYESMLQSLDADIAITEAMIRSDVTEIRFRRANVNEAAIEALHEGVISKIWDVIVNGIKWIWDKVKAFFSMVCNAVKNFFKKIGEMISRAFGGSKPENKKAVEEIKKIQDQLKIPEEKRDSFEELQTKVKNLSDEEMANLCNNSSYIQELMKKNVENELKSKGIQPDEIKNLNKTIEDLNKEKEALQQKNKELEASKNTALEKQKNKIEELNKKLEILDSLPKGERIYIEKVANLKPISGEDLKDIKHGYTYKIINGLVFLWKNRGEKRFNSNEYNAKVQWYESDLISNVIHKSSTINIFNFAKYVLGTIKNFDLPNPKTKDGYRFLIYIKDTLLNNDEEFDRYFNFTQAKKIFSDNVKELSKTTIAEANKFNTFRTENTIDKFCSLCVNEVESLEQLIKKKSEDFKKQSEEIHKKYGTTTVKLANGDTITKNKDEKINIDTSHSWSKNIEDVLPYLKKALSKYRDKYIKICQDIEKEMKTRLILFNKNIKSLVTAKHEPGIGSFLPFVKKKVQQNINADIKKYSYHMNDLRDSYKNMIYTNDSAISFDDIDLNNQYLDEQFILEMSEYEIEQIFENTYTDRYGRIVCNF